MTPDMTKYKNAEMNIQVLQFELKKAGFEFDARVLDSVEVSCAQSAQVAIDVVKHLRLANGHTPQAVLDAQKWAIDRLFDVTKG